MEAAPIVASAGARIARELFALALIAFAAFGTVSLLSVDLGRTPNLGGPVGAAIAAALDNIVGYQSYTAMLLVAWLAHRVWTGSSLITMGREIAGGLLLILALATASALWNLHDVRAGGQLGALVANLLNDSLNLAGGLIAVVLGLICGFALMLNRAPTELLSSLSFKIRRRRIDELDLAAGDTRVPFSLDFDDEVGPDHVNGKPQPLKVKLLELRDASSREMREKRDKAAAMKPRQKGAYKLPPQSLLDLPPAEHTQVDEGQLERSARVLEQKLAVFGVEGRVVEVQPGPVVTMYKFEPGSGIKVSQIVNLSDDLSMALRAAAVRIQAPVPGEAVVGIEVPNRKRERVYLREILEAEEFVAAQSQLTIALGKDIAGRAVAADLAKMPHLLIAGATGTGKSVSIHTMIASILFNATADDVRLILV
ncbi:MAG TPA: DNA translocase FtsK 4TM domain-containing protein, partial [Sporolactobacillaceae bacterium]|nr:DNA translocase FtsK 4TM domain-containing protein [Sporolactobacillaceae bacterium]